MPEAVNYYVKNAELLEIRKIQNKMLKAYLHDFSKRAPGSDIMKLSAIWESIPKQLAKENKKFTFAMLSKSARAREYENAIQWLINAGLILKANLVETPKLPLESYCNKNSFK